MKFGFVSVLTMTASLTIGVSFAEEAKLGSYFPEVLTQLRKDGVQEVYVDNLQKAAALADQPVPEDWPASDIVGCTLGIVTGVPCPQPQPEPKLPPGGGVLAPPAGGGGGGGTDIQSWLDEVCKIAKCIER